MKHSQPRRRLSPCTRACVHWLTFYFADKQDGTPLATVIRDAQQVGFNAGTTTPAINDMARRGLVAVVGLGDAPLVVAKKGYRERLATPANDDVF